MASVGAAPSSKMTGSGQGVPAIANLNLQFTSLENAMEVSGCGFISQTLVQVPLPIAPS